ncbi:MAG: PKD domain-containing protein [Thermoplasmata archaeon]
MVNVSVTDVGLPVRLNVTISGGAGQYNRTWFGLPEGCSTANTSALVCRPGALGIYSVSVEVRDALGTIVWSTSTEFQVNARPSAVGIGPAPGNLNAGIVPWNTTLVASWKGGTAPFSFAWTFGDGTENGSGNPVTHEYSETGNFSVSVRLTDSLGVAAPFAYDSIESRSPFSLELDASTNNTSVGGLITLVVVATGGFPPYTYSWSGLPASCSSSNEAILPCSPMAPGTYTATVRVSDHIAENVTASVTFEVRSPATGGPPSELIRWVVGAAAVGAVVAGIWLLRRARRRPSGTPDPLSSRPPERPPSE